MGILVSAMIIVSSDSEKLQEVYYNGVKEGKRIAFENLKVENPELEVDKSNEKNCV